MSIPAWNPVREVPPSEIEKAVERKRKFEENPTEHTYEE